MKQIDKKHEINKKIIKKDLEIYKIKNEYKKIENPDGNNDVIRSLNENENINNLDILFKK